MEFYRVKLYTHDNDAKEYCESNNILAIGWGNTYNAETTEDYIDKFINNNNKSRGEYSSIKNMINMDMKIENFVWRKKDGLTYWLGHIMSDYYLTTDTKVKDKGLDIGLVRDCVWNKEIEFDDVPGQIISQFVGGGTTLTHVNCNDELKKYCEWLFYGKKTEIIITDYKCLLHSDDLEDLLGLYLQQGIKDEKDEEYYIIPSTNKTSTKLIEYELRRKKDGKKACVQCKIGNDTVGNGIFTEFKDYHRIFIATCSDVDYDNRSNNVKTIKMDDLWKWAKNNYKILPKRIQTYVDITK